MSNLNASSVSGLFQAIYGLRQIYSKDYQRVWFDTPYLRTPEFMDIRLLPESFCKNLEQNILHMKKFMETEDKPYKGFKDYEIAKIQRIVDYMKSDIDNSEQKKADFYRYLIEIEPDRHAIEVTLDLYSQAYSLACEHLFEADPVRLGVVLNYAIFLRDYCDQYSRGLSLIRNGYESALDVTVSMSNVEKDILDLLDLFKAYMIDQDKRNAFTAKK